MKNLLGQILKLRGEVILLVVSALSLSIYTGVQIWQSNERENARDELRIEIADIVAQYQNGKTQVIDLSKLSSITWDRFYIIGPVMSYEHIQKKLDVAWLPDQLYDSERPFDYLVFTLKGEVVQYVEYPRSGDLSFSGTEVVKESYKPEDAVFILNKNGYVIHVDK